MEDSPSSLKYESHENRPPQKKLVLTPREFVSSSWRARCGVQYLKWKERWFLWESDIAVDVMSET